MRERTTLSRWRGIILCRKNLAFSSMENARTENKLKEYEAASDEYQMLTHLLQLLDADIARLPADPPPMRIGPVRRT